MGNVRIAVPEPYRIAAEFFRWEFATAVAGSILGIHAFDQPDVEASKIATRRLTDEFERTGRLPAETPILEADGIRLFADARNARELAGGGQTLAGVLHAHLGRLRPGDYAAFLGYVEMTAAHEAALQAMRVRVRRSSADRPSSRAAMRACSVSGTSSDSTAPVRRYVAPS